MWNSFVSIAYTGLNETIFRFVDLFWRHPIVGFAFLVAFVVLTVLLWIEVLKEGPAMARAADRLEDVRPIRLQRRS